MSGLEIGLSIALVIAVAAIGCLLYLLTVAARLHYKNKKRTAELRRLCDDAVALIEQLILEKVRATNPEALERVTH